jgi:LAO/AO transport system kinase
VTASVEELLQTARDRLGEPASKVALARLISLVERGGQEARTIGSLAWPLAGNAYSIGVTGAPGAGKSTLNDSLIVQARAAGPVAVVAIDPTSPFTGGAILGDRIRMSDHYEDQGVFIRSMATRGHMGGLAFAVPETVRLLDAVGFPTVLIETVGVGQIEVEVAGAADTTVVVVNPGWGDSVQANKAGLMEVADVFVVNKADRPGARETVRDLETMLDLSPDPSWRPPVVTTVATTGEGAAELYEAVCKHRAYLEETGQLAARRSRRLADELEKVVRRRLEALVDARWTEPEVVSVRDRCEARELDPYAAAEEIVEQVLGSPS